MITVAICTRDRERSLAETLAAFREMTVPPGLEWELLLADNGTVPLSPAALEPFAGRLPMRIVRVETAGLSHARNAVTASARGEAIVWTDDDVTPGAGWLAAYGRALAEHPAVGLFGGAIRPRFLSPAPAWVEEAWDEVSLFFAAREPPAVGAEVEPGYVPFGANFALRTEVQRRFPYDPRLGRRGAVLRSGEEWDVLQRALADGVRGLWIDAPVEHRIGAERLRLDHVRALAREMGRTGAETLRGVGPSIFGRPLGLWRRAAAAGARYGIARLGRRPAVWVPRLIEAEIERGRLEGAGSGGRT